MRSPEKTYDDILEVLKEYRPDLVEEWKGLRHEGIYVAGDWLEKHFPEIGWGTTLVHSSPDVLRAMFESKK